jgi:hypothetical protein
MYSNANYIMIIPRLRDPGNTIQASSGHIIDVPRQTSFRIPNPGQYTSLIRSITLKHRQSTTHSIPFVRIGLAVQVPGAEVDYMAKIDLKLDLSEGSDLWNVICRLKGRKALQDASGKQFDLDTLIGTLCDIEVEHIWDKADDYDFPLVVVTNLQLAGTLVKTAAEGGN